MLTELDSLIRSALTLLVSDIFDSGWSGRREREVISLFAFGPLLQQCRTSGFLHDPTQIGIEVPVPQIAGQARLRGGSSAKSQVCKDLVIWPRPRMTCWDSAGLPTVYPASIIEWKFNEDAVSDYDVEWLTEFSTDKDDFIGYAVCVDQRSPRRFRLSCSRVQKGQQELQWLFIT